ncbi:hypothetical protein [Paenibacillus sp. LHD-38]|uniref:hypothetical protein n=1 Tax=Paenibacillus sp. LHD-38 TaxID=3072143 RepID=UPI00280D0509|nr:hypothetical protein [Paenibacillus sp. LHD-38]MDQ8739244.1 hypothetical protein [Paenibacillus sp. LHD-38]
MTNRTITIKDPRFSKYTDKIAYKQYELEGADNRNKFWSFPIKGYPWVGGDYEEPIILSPGMTYTSYVLFNVENGYSPKTRTYNMLEISSHGNSAMHDNIFIRVPLFTDRDTKPVVNHIAKVPDEGPYPRYFDYHEYTLANGLKIKKERVKKVEGTSTGIYKISFSNTSSTNRKVSNLLILDYVDEDWNGWASVLDKPTKIIKSGETITLEYKLTYRDTWGDDVGKEHGVKWSFSNPFSSQIMFSTESNITFWLEDNYRYLGIN